MGGDWPIGWEHLADLCEDCTPVLDPDTGDLEYPTMPPDSARMYVISTVKFAPATLVEKLPPLAEA